MKKLNKLSINPEKVIKKDELTNLRGGYDGGEDQWCYRHCYQIENGEYVGGVTYQSMYYCPPASICSGYTGTWCTCEL